MSSPKQYSEPQDLIHRDSFSASSLQQIISQLLSWQTHKFSWLSAPQPRREMPSAFLQVTFYSILSWQEHLSASEHTWNVCAPTGEKMRWEREQISPTSLKKQEYFCFLKKTSNLLENCSLSPNNCSEVAHLEDKQHQFPKPVRQCDLASLIFTKTTVKIWNLRRNIVIPSSSTYPRPV